MSELDKKIKKHFEANMLDGDEVQKGQMIASTAVLEYLQEYIPELIKDICEKLLGDKEIYWTDHWGEEHNSITNDMSSRNNLRSEQLATLKKELGDE